jgi:hypothetical protein
VTLGGGIVTEPQGWRSIPRTKCIAGAISDGCAERLEVERQVSDGVVPTPALDCGPLFGHPNASRVRGSDSRWHGRTRIHPPSYRATQRSGARPAAADGYRQRQGQPGHRQARYAAERQPVARQAVKRSSTTRRSQDTWRCRSCRCRVAAMPPTRLCCPCARYSMQCLKRYLPSKCVNESRRRTEQ